MDFDRVAIDWLRAMRGRRSQTALSRRLGYKTNAVYRWESGARTPSASEALRVAARVGRAPEAALRRFAAARAIAAPAYDIAPARLAAWLSAVCAAQSHAELARRSGLSRFSVARALQGRSHVSWPDFLRLLDAATRRALDFVAHFVDPAQLPSAARAWARHEAFHSLARDHPLSEGALALIQLDDYQHARPALDDAWLAARLRVPTEQVAATLEALAAAGLIHRARGRWRVHGQWEIETVPRRGAAVRPGPFWMQRVAQMDLPTTRGRYAVFNCSAEEYERIAEIWARAYLETREVLSQSTAADRAAVLVYALVDLTSAEGERG